MFHEIVWRSSPQMHHQLFVIWHSSSKYLHQHCQLEVTERHARTAQTRKESSRIVNATQTRQLPHPAAHDAKTPRHSTRHGGFHRASPPPPLSARRMGSSAFCSQLFSGGCEVPWATNHEHRQAPQPQQPPSRPPTADQQQFEVQATSAQSSSKSATCCGHELATYLHPHAVS